MTGHAIVAGGSIGGLFAAAALRSIGWRVDVYERTDVELSGRGAGIVTHGVLIDALTQVGAQIDALGIEVAQRIAYDQDGEVVARLDYPQIVTSWDRIHSILRATIPDAHHHLGREIVGYRQSDTQATALFRDGAEESADLVIGADGFRSAVRAQMLPEVTPSYAGYVVWRALAQEADLGASVHAQVFDYFGVFAPSGTQIIGYPIAGRGNDLRPGHRRYNFVWYAQVPQDQLEDMLTDASGTTHAISIPPPLVRDTVLDDMYRDAKARLPAPFVSILNASERPFFTPIYDHHSPIMAQGRVVLSGDAACVARPHVGMGVTKAAQDALSLAHHLQDTGDIQAALRAYSNTRVQASRAAYDRAQMLGRYVFQEGGGALNPHGRANPNLDEILKVTASADF